MAKSKVPVVPLVLLGGFCFIVVVTVIILLIWKHCDWFNFGCPASSSSTPPSPGNFCLLGAPYKRVINISSPMNTSFSAGDVVSYMDQTGITFYTCLTNTSNTDVTNTTNWASCQDNGYTTNMKPQEILAFYLDIFYFYNFSSTNVIPDSQYDIGDGTLAAISLASPGDIAAAEAYISSGSPGGSPTVAVANLLAAALVAQEP